MIRRVAPLFAACIAFAASAQYPLGDCVITVVDESGKPLAGVPVDCVNWDNDSPRVTPLQSDEQGKTDAQGRVTFHNKYLGQSFARVQAGKLGGWFRLQEQKDGRNEQTVTPGLGRTVKGVVRDEQNEPIAGVQVLVDGCLPATKTDKEGRYAVPNMGIGYAHSFGYYKDGYAWAVESPREDMLSVDIVMKKGADVEGVVLDPDRKPVADAYVSAGYRYGSCKTDDKGRFRVYALPAGVDNKITASQSTQQGYYLGGETVVNFAGKPRDPVTILLERREYKPKPVLRGKVIRADNGKPVTAAMLSSQEEHTPTGNPGATDKNGDFVIDNYQGGMYWISARPLNPTLYVIGGPVQVNFDKQPLEDLVLKVEEGCCIRGRAITDDGTPIANKWVMINPWAGFVTMTETRENGTFVFGNLDGVGVTYTISMTDDLGRSQQVAVGPMKKGEVREGVELRMPPMIEPHHLRGVVRDAQGKPLANVLVMPTYENNPGAVSLKWPVTDDAGRFDVNVVTSGRIKIAASTSVNVNISGEKQDRQQYFKVLSNEVIDLDATRDTDVEFVMELLPKTMLGGRVVDESGQGIAALVTAYKDERNTESGSCDRSGNFFLYKTPEPPYLLEIMATGYRARVQVMDRAATESASDFAVALKPGPFVIGESVWSAVTGQPATDAAVEAMPFSQHVRESESRYYHDAKPRPAPPANATAQPQFYTPRVRFLDAKGAPVTRVLIQPLQSMPMPAPVLYKPETGRQAKAQVSDDGIYNVTGDLSMGYSYGWVAWADGTGRVSERLDQTRDANAVVDVVLRPAASVAVTVTDADGKPAPKLPVCLLGQQPEYDNYAHLQIGTTDDAGQVAFEQLAPGAHAFMIGSFGVNQRQIAFRLADGESKALTVRLSTDLADPGWLMQTWRVAKEGNAPLPKSAAEHIAALDHAKRDKLAAYVREQLDLVVDINRQIDGRERELKFLTALALQLGDKQAMPIFQRAVRMDTRSSFNNFAADFATAARAMTLAIAQLGGDDSLEFLAEIAADTRLSNGARCGAVQAFGAIGTEKSAATFAQLRDAYRAKPGMPPAKDHYTHAEKMIETLYFYRVALTWDYTWGNPPGFEIMKNYDATVSSDYKTGTLYISGAYEGANYNMVRVGDEWLIKELAFGWIV